MSIKFSLRGTNLIEELKKYLLNEISVCNFGSNPIFKFLFLKILNGYSFGIVQTLKFFPH